MNRKFDIFAFLYNDSVKPGVSELLCHNRYFVENEEVICEYNKRNHSSSFQIAAEIPLFLR